VSGDRWAVGYAQAGRTILVADGSGHGIEAARAADRAVRTFHDRLDDSCERLTEQLHRALMPTRGAAVAVARIDPVAHTIRYVGVGNINGLLISNGTMRHMVSNNGTAGHVAPRIREFTYDFSDDPLVILHSDGLTSKWDLAGYPGLLTQHPSLIAGVLLRDLRRGRDDASVVAVRALL
jgi:serine phosphatase RsbU (regulator of sigma subunit)